QALGGAGGAGGQLAVARGQRGASQPGRQGGIAEQEPGPGLQIGAQLAEVAKNGGWPVARLGDLRLGQGGFGTRVDVSELRAGRGTAGNVLGRRRDVAAAQFDRAQHAVRGRGVPVRAEGPGGGQGRLDVGGSVWYAAAGQVDAGAQDGQGRLGRDVPHRRVVG